MKILIIGQNALDVTAKSRFLDEVFEDASIDTATSIAQVKKCCITDDYDLVISGFKFDGILSGEWPGFVYSWFASAKLVFLYNDIDEIEKMHDVLRSRSLFVNRSTPYDQFCDLMRRLTSSAVQEHGEKVA